MLRRLHRRPAVLRAHRALVPPKPPLNSAGLDERLRKQLGNSAAATPLFGEQLFQFGEVRELRYGVGALEPRLHDDALEREPERCSRGNPRKIVEQRRACLVRVLGLLPEHPVRVAVALVRRPCVDVRASFVRGFARLINSIDEPIPSKERRVEGLCEYAGTIVVDRPAGGDDTAHANLDQRAGNAGCEARPVVIEKLFVVAACQMAAVHEHQLGNRPHVANFIGPEERARRQHDAATAAIGGGHAVTCNVHDAPTLLEYRVHDRSSVRTWLIRVLADECGTSVASSPPEPVRQFRTTSASRRAPYSRGYCSGHSGSPMTSTRSAGIGVDDLLAIARRSQLPQQLDANRPGRRLARVAIEQFPWNPRGARIKLDDHFAAARQVGLDLDRHEQIEQGPPEVFIVILIARRLGDEVSNERALRPLPPHLAARPPRIERECDRRLGTFVVLGFDGDEIVIRRPDTRCRVAAAMARSPP